MAFLDLLYRQGQAREDMAVLHRLTEEKNAQHERVQGALRDHFEIEPDGQYVYDPDRRMILVAADENREARLHRALPSDEAVRLFIQLVEGRRLIQETLRVLQSMGTRRQEELRAVETELLDRFAIRSDRVYQYDPATATVYEIVGMEGRADASEDAR